MKPVDRYIQDVLDNVLATPEDAERLEADLRAHFAEAESRGEAPSQIIDHMGQPEDVAAAFNAERDVPYAGFWQRVVAFTGDCGLLLALFLPPLSVAAVAARFMPDGEISIGGANGATPIGWVVALVLVALAMFGIFVFYFPILEARFGKTFGKHLLRIRVVRENGAQISLGQAFVRRLSLFFKLTIPDALFVPFTDKRQRALDIIAKTVVVREPGEQAPGWAWAVCLLLPVASALAVAGLIMLCAPS